MKTQQRKKGQSIIEFVAVTVFILAALMVFQKYIVRGFSGRWKMVGDSLGQGRIYDPKKTVECATNVFFDGQMPTWYGKDCFEENCKDDCLEVTRDQARCTSCIAGCAESTPECADPK